VRTPRAQRTATGAQALAGRLLATGASACMVVLPLLAALSSDARAAGAPDPSRPALAQDLQRAKEDAQQRENAFLAGLDANLFEAQQALQGGQAARAIEQAERALTGAAYATNAAQAARLRARAEAILAEAHKAEQKARAAQQQAGMTDGRERAARSQAAELRQLRERGWKHIETGQYDQALTVADEMLRTEPGNREALFLRHEALRVAEQRGDAKALRAERRQLQEKILNQVKAESIPPKDIIPKLLLSGKDEPPARAAAAEAALPPWEQRLRTRLRDTITVEFKNCTIAEACRYLAGVTDTTILVDPVVAKAAERITLPEMTLSYEHVLRWICRFWQATFTLRDHAILVTTRGGLLDEPVTRDYDISGLLLPMRVVRSVFNGDVQLDETTGTRSMLSPVTATTEQGEERFSKEAIGEGWARFIRSTVAAETWDEPHRGKVAQEKAQYAIQYRNGRIVVVHTPEVQEQVAKLLDNFRKARNLQVHILSRFLQLRTDYLQQIDINLGSEGGALGFDSRPGASPSTQTSIFGTFTNDEQVSLVKGGVDAAGGLNLSYTHLNDWQVNALLHAVLKRRKGTLLVAPRLTCFNTQRANFQAVTNYNYVRSITSDNEPEIGNVPDGIVYDVQPFVSADRRYITLVLQPQMRTLHTPITTFQFIRPVPGFIGPERFVQVPEVELKSIATTVTIPDGGSLLVGGLAEATENRGYASAPLFNGIPAIKYLFRGWTEVEGRTSLVVVTTAQIVPDIFESE